MARLCERPGCSAPGEAAYGMVAEDLLFWIEPLDGRVTGGSNVLCRRHADAMVVPRGWTLDDRRQAGGPRLFQPQRFGTPATPAPAGPGRQRARAAAVRVGEQLQLDGTGEIPRPSPPPAPVDALAEPQPEAQPEPEPEPEAPWRPSFDVDDDLGGLLEVKSPLLARAFRGTGRPRRR